MSAFVREPLPILSVSHSEISTFQDCPRRWWLTYYRELGVRRDLADPTGARQLGGRIHAALQAMYERGVNPIDAIDEIYAYDVQMLIAAGMEDKITKLKEEQDLAHAMLEGYLDWAAENAIDAEYDIVSVEEILEVESGIPGVRLRCMLDQRIQRRSDGSRLFRDWKTTGSFEALRGTLYMDPQMRHYHLLEQLHAAYVARVGTDLHDGEGRARMWRTDGALYLMLRKVKRTAAAKPPFYDQLAVPHNRKIIENTWKRVHKVLMQIVETRDHLDRGGDHQYLVPPRVTRDCSWKCDFFPVCPLFDDGSNVEGLLGERYEHRDPHERYHRDQQKEKS